MIIIIIMIIIIVIILIMIIHIYIYIYIYIYMNKQICMGENLTLKETASLQRFNLEKWAQPLGHLNFQRAF